MVKGIKSRSRKKNQTRSAFPDGNEAAGSASSPPVSALYEDLWNNLSVSDAGAPLFEFGGDRSLDQISEEPSARADVTSERRASLIESIVPSSPCPSPPLQFPQAAAELFDSLQKRSKAFDLEFHVVEHGLVVHILVSREKKILGSRTSDRKQKRKERKLERKEKKKRKYESKKRKAYGGTLLSPEHELLEGGAAAAATAAVATDDFEAAQPEGEWLSSIEGKKDVLFFQPSGIRLEGEGLPSLGKSKNLLVFMSDEGNSMKFVAPSVTARDKVCVYVVEDEGGEDIELKCKVYESELSVGFPVSSFQKGCESENTFYAWGDSEIWCLALQDTDVLVENRWPLTSGTVDFCLNPYVGGFATLDGTSVNVCRADIACRVRRMPWESSPNRSSKYKLDGSSLYTCMAWWNHPQTLLLGGATLASLDLRHNKVTMVASGYESYMHHIPFFGQIEAVACQSSQIALVAQVAQSSTDRLALIFDARKIDVPVIQWRFVDTTSAEHPVVRREYNFQGRGGYPRLMRDYRRTLEFGQGRVEGQQWIAIPCLGGRCTTVCVWQTAPSSNSSASLKENSAENVYRVPCFGVSQDSWKGHLIGATLCHGRPKPGVESLFCFSSCGVLCQHELALAPLIEEDLQWPVDDDNSSSEPDGGMERMTQLGCTLDSLSEAVAHWFQIGSLQVARTLQLFGLAVCDEDKGQGLSRRPRGPYARKGGAIDWQKVPDSGPWHIDLEMQISGPEVQQSPSSVILPCISPQELSQSQNFVENGTLSECLIALGVTLPMGWTLSLDISKGSSLTIHDVLAHIVQPQGSPSIHITYSAIQVLLRTLVKRNVLTCVSGAKPGGRFDTYALNLMTVDIQAGRPVRPRPDLELLSGGRLQPAVTRDMASDIWDHAVSRPSEFHRPAANPNVSASSTADRLRSVIANAYDSHPRESSRVVTPHARASSMAEHDSDSDSGGHSHPRVSSQVATPHARASSMAEHDSDSDSGHHSHPRESSHVALAENDSDSDSENHVHPRESSHAATQHAPASKMSESDSGSDD